MFSDPRLFVPLLRVPFTLSVLSGSAHTMLSRSRLFKLLAGSFVTGFVLNAVFIRGGFYENQARAIAKDEVRQRILEVKNRPRPQADSTRS